MPADTFTHTAHSSVTPGDVYRALQDLATWRGIGPIADVWNATHDPDASLTGFRWRAHAAGRDWEGVARRTALVPDRSIVFDLDSSEVAGSIAVGLEPDGVGTTLTVVLTVRSKGFLAGMFWGIIADALRSGFPHQVEEFAARF